MNWVQLAMLIAEIVKKIIENRRPKVGAAGPEAMTAICSDAEADALAASLEAAAGPVPMMTAGQPMTHEQGIVAHITELVAALRAKDWGLVRTLVVDLLSHL